MSIPSARRAPSDDPTELRDPRPPLKIPQAADLSGFSISTIRRLIREGELPVIRVGQNIIRIPRADLERFLDEHTVAVKS